MNDNIPQHTGNNSLVENSEQFSGLNSCCVDVLSADWDRDGDIFNRSQYADRLNTLVKNTKSPYVIALSSAWGTGKTYFLNAWKNKHGYKENDTNKTPCIYFSAWENEEDDPRIAIVSAIKTNLECNKLLQKKETESFAKKATKCITKPQIFGKLVLRIFKEYFNKKTENSIDDIFAETFSEQAESLIDRYAEKNENKLDFIKELKNIVEQVKTKTNSPILIMIDELDRCKPDYVIHLLESIKHFFSVNGLVFVLAIDQNQLLSIVEHTFGLKDEQRQIYLEKFIDLFFKLPEADIIVYAKQLILEYFSEVPMEFIHPMGSEYTNPLTSTIPSFYADLATHQQVLLKIVEDSLEDITSLRNFEKRFFKFLTIYKAYKPCFAYFMLLFKNILTVDKKTKFNEFLCKKLFEKSVNGSEEIWTNEILQISLYISSERATPQNLDRCVRV